MDYFENLETKPKNSMSKWPVLILLLAIFFGLGYVIGQKKVVITDGQLQINRGNPATTADYSLLWDVLDTLNSKFVDRPLDQQKLLYGAAAGLVDAAGDPYTVFFDPEQSKQFQDELDGKFEGIGAEISIKQEQLVVLAPLEGTPAARAGILPGDKILAIDGETTAGLSIDEAASKIRGHAGTSVTLTILHKEQREPSEIELIRERIEVRSLKFETLEVDGQRLGLITLSRFGEDTKGLLDHAVDVILAGNYQGVILDLRNNPGGFLDTAISTASNWVPDGKAVVKEVNYAGEVDDFEASGVARLSGIKTVVLINEGSASASEIVAGALQDYDLATLVGEKTFGKGSVQEIIELKGDSSLKVSTAKWQTPNGRNINEEGLEPDIMVERTSEDFENDRDPQMEKALELFK